MKAKTGLLYGRTGSGKTAQLGRLAEDIFVRTGKKSRLYTGDRGGLDTIQPYVELGLIDAVEMGDTDPFLFVNKAVQGQVRDTKTGKWVPGQNDEVGGWFFESLRAFAESMMTSMHVKAAQGINIGGSGNINFIVSGEGEQLKISGGNMAMFGVAQQQMSEAIWASHRLPGEYILWTSTVSKDDDTISSGKVLGPDVIGKALTADVPKWFNYTFRIDVIPSQGGKPERHILYLGTSVDTGAGNAATMGNIRTPLDAAALPPTLEPADIVKAMSLIDSAKSQALETVRKRISR